VSLRQRLGEAGSRAAAAGSAAREALADRVPAAPDGNAVTAWLANVPMPQAPATQPWTLSIGTLAGRAGTLPPVADRALGLLDRFGRVSVGPDQVGIDNDDVRWSEVTAVRTTPAGAMLGQNAVGHELERIKRLLPPVPGRAAVLAQAETVLGALLARALGSPGADVVAAIESTGRLGRTRTMSVGLAAALVLSAMPEVDRSIRATAEARGIPVWRL
jgi:hypothetical protein